MLSATLMMRDGIHYSFRDIERVKDSLAFVNRLTGALMMLDEEELVGQTVEPSPILKAKHEVATLPALIAWLGKNARKA